MKSILVSVLVCIFIAASGLQANGEEWTTEQKDVWKLVENYWEYAKKNDFKSFRPYYEFDNCIEWSSSKILPIVGRDAILKDREKWFIYDKVLSYELLPIKIHIVDDVAIVAYQWKYEGSMFSRSSRQMDTYIKKNDKWVFLSGMGSSCEELPICR